MKAIDKAWKENLKLDKEDQWQSKEDIIENICPYEFQLKDNPECSSEGEDINECTRCWNKEIEEDKDAEIQDDQLTFEKLQQSPIDKITLNDFTETNLKDSLEDDDTIIFAEDSKITYEEMLKLINWLQYVYNYCTELKDKVEYVDFIKAKDHMKNGNGCELDGYFYDKDSEFTIKDIESDKWVLL